MSTRRRCANCAEHNGGRYKVFVTLGGLFIKCPSCKWVHKVHLTTEKEVNNG